MTKILAINSGSSSLKFQLFEMPEEKVITKGLVERIGIENSMFTIEYNGEKIKETLDFIRTMTVGGMNFDFIVDYLLTQDNYMCLADFESYVAAQEKVAETYQDKEKWGQMSLVNTANAGIFSADRSVEEYAKDIWNIKKVK